ncbi:MAG: hypothetical protein GY757_41050 [bacterium]|nr:hypothetical protein [bacterium]
MKKRKLFSYTDEIIIGLLLAFLSVAVFLLYTNVDAYKRYIDEDGIVEWVTVIGLLCCTAISIFRFFHLKNHKKKLFLIFLLLTAFVFFFGAGEELSWGQRIFDIQSGDFFNQHNTQKETNIHNLVFGGIRLNKILFSLLLSICVCLFLFVLPVLYRKNEKTKSFTEALAVPVPRNYQIVFYILLFIVIGIIQDSRKWELLEMGGALLFLAIVANPLNKEMFSLPGKQKD